ncbi:MAG TPA: DUF2079 domain-containing protein [Polyangiaceae bacterium]|nr:DUF2079 domain-containing protein [Polyangiaceae bacterium]
MLDSPSKNPGKKPAGPRIDPDQLIARALHALTSFLLWPVLISVALGSGLWAHAHPAELPLLATNKLPQPLRIQGVLWVAAAAGGVALLYAGAALARRIRTGSAQLVATTSTLNKLLFPLLALPLTAALRLPEIEKESPKVTLFFVALTAAICARAFYAWPTPTPSDDALDASPSPRRERLFKALAALALILIGAGYAAFFSRLAITNHHALNTRTADLGYYDNIFYQSIHGNPLGCSFLRSGVHSSAHFDPILILLSPIYFIYQRAETLLVFQSAWLGAGVIPLYLLARERRMTRPAGLILALIYAAYPALHGANLYEFHSLTLITPLLLWLLYFLEIDATKRYFAVLVALLLCREDVSLLLCFVGVHAILSLRPKRVRLGTFTILLGVAYFIVAKGAFMRSTMLGGYSYYYEELIPEKKGAVELLISLVTNPAFAVKLALEEGKILFIALLFLPLAFLPFAAKSGRIMLVYGFLFCLLASRDPVYSVHFQYTSVLFPIAFALTPAALRRIEEHTEGRALNLSGPRLARALLGAGLVAGVLVGLKFGALADNASFRGGFHPLARSLTVEQERRYTWLRQTIAKIPKNASVGATRKLGPHISNRAEAYIYPYKDGYPEKPADYVLADETELKDEALEAHKKALGQRELVEIVRNGTFALFMRKDPGKP